MTHRIYQFGAVALPPAMPEDDLSTGQVDSTLLDSIGGVYDWRGTGTRLPRRQTINLRGMYELTNDGALPGNASSYLIDHSSNFIVDHAGNRIIVDSAVMALRRNVSLLKAQLGTRQNLYRRREDDGLVTWKLARLLKVGYVRTIDDAGAVANIETVFETRMAAWRAIALTTVSAALPAGLAISNYGGQPVNDAILRVLAVDPISSVTVTGTGINLTWTGTLGAGGTLEINAGTQTVRIGGSDQYAGLTRNAGHTAAGWLPIPAGGSVILVTGNGAGTAEITFYEQNL